MKRTLYLIFIFSSVFLISCDKDENEEVISRHGDLESHNTGQNCMNCHNSEGDGEGIFSIAGSVYDTTQINPFPNANVILYTGPNGSGNVVKNIEVDEYGNFFTTESISFENELFVSVLNPNGTETFMSIPVENGECNSCHGSSAVRIYIP